MSRCIHVYSFVARNHGGIPFSGVCPYLFRAGHDLHIEHRFGAMIIEQQDVQHRIMREQYNSEPWGEPYRSGLGTVRATSE